MTRQSLISRRRVLGVFGAGTTVALAGCSGNGQGGSSGDSGSGGNDTESSTGSTDTSGDGSGSDGTDSGSQDTEDSGSTGSTGNEPGEYPTQETSGWEAELDSQADSEEAFGFKIEDFDYLNIESFPDAEQENLNPFEEALYFAATGEGDFEKADAIYFGVRTPEAEDFLSPIGMYIGLESDVFNRDRYVNGNPETVLEQEENSYNFDIEEAYDDQADFFRDHVDPDGIVHAVDLDEHDYAVEALHSGFGSE